MSPPTWSHDRPHRPFVQVSGDAAETDPLVQVPRGGPYP